MTNSSRWLLRTIQGGVGGFSEAGICPLALVGPPQLEGGVAVCVAKCP